MIYEQDAFSDWGSGERSYSTSRDINEALLAKMVKIEQPEKKIREPVYAAHRIDCSCGECTARRQLNIYNEQKQMKELLESLNRNVLFLGLVIIILMIMGDRPGAPVHQYTAAPPTQQPAQAVG